MYQTGNFSPEWGYLAPAPRFLRTVRLVVVASAIAASASAGVVFALVREPIAEASVAVRTLVPPPETPAAPPASRLADWRIDHAAMPATAHTAGATWRESAPAVAAVENLPAGPPRIASAPSRELIAAPTEAAKKPAVVALAAPGARATGTAAMIDAAASSKTADGFKAVNKKVRGVTQAKGPASDASQLRVATAQRGVRSTTQSSATSSVHSTIAANRDMKARDDDTLLTKTLGVTDHVIAATQRAVSTIGGVPSWIGSIGNRLGG
jgi:hypothetical protein